MYGRTLENELCITTKVFLLCYNRIVYMRTFIFIALLSGALALGHIGGARFEWYLDFWWFDIVMHILGGAVVGGLCVALYVRMISQVSVRGALLVSVTAAVVIGVGWEIFEWYFDLIYTVHYVTDTVTDLVMDMVGGLFIVRTLQQYRLLV